MMSASSLSSWYVVHCQPRKEKHVADALRDSLGLLVYLPEADRHYHGQVERVPFFPRYLFVYADLQATSVSRVNATPGVVRILAFGGAPTVVPTSVIATIREQLSRLQAGGGLPRHPFHAGDAVRLKIGPLGGLEGVFVGPSQPRDRVRVLLEFLGRLTEIEVEPEVLEETRGPLPTRPERRTRGCGRPISPSRPAA
jgi:transcriptional antiterminator RfaH